MNLLVRIGRLILTFAIFIVAQALLAASINSMFELVPIKIDRIFPRDKTAIVATAAVDAADDAVAEARIAEDQSLVGRLEGDVSRAMTDLKRRKAIDERKRKHTVPTMLTGEMTSTAVIDTTGAGATPVRHSPTAATRTTSRIS